MVALTRPRALWAMAGLALVLGGGIVTGSLSAAQGVEAKNRAVLSDLATAASLLGSSVPEPKYLPLGLGRSGIGIDPPDKPTPRIVHISYAIAGVNVALLNVMRAEIRPLLSDVSQTVVDGTTFLVEERALPDGTVLVGYSWNRNGLGHSLQLKLQAGLTRSEAERIAASVR